jgi:hypothetical protein
MKKRAIQTFQIMLVGFIVFLLSGCLYPDDMRKENQVAAKEYIFLVQKAIDDYREDTGVLPIKNSTQETPIYEKYAIDFKKLKARGYLSQIPVNAFENGGTYYYVLVNVEEHAEVKLMDLISLQKAGDLQRLVDSYRNNHGGEIAKGMPMAPHYYTVDFEKIGKPTEQIKSVYSNAYLGFLIDDSGTIVIDYGPEIRKAINKRGSLPTDKTTDLREYLVEGSPFVPVRSAPYYWIDGEPRITFE